MPWIGTVDSSHWTADFRLARLLEYVYARTGRGRPVVVVGMGLSLDGPGTIGPTVASELAKVHPYVFGQTGQPVARHNMAGVFFHITQEFPHSFVLVVDGTTGEAEEDGHVIAWSGMVEPDEEFLEARQALGAVVSGRPAFPTALDERQVPRTVTIGADLASLPVHVGLIGVVGPLVGSASAHERKLATTCDAIIDGILRFFYRTGQLI
ncbi:DUF1256 domain-containing protein [Carboxydochorda subterranea]|uniref:DUF1256 domain-containing protein n=1 Tax=Carboxydichorda subterranea TaxID=3109565 RepID=A0ABZ1BX76_9FIRM|nr:DUF1256 domain-containing protein [Limnochorda sp. L945t]WRP17372.1 DUF1256 domain-containing protein [Limnochorda sp. L945t]